MKKVIAVILCVVTVILSAYPVYASNEQEFDLESYGIDLSVKIDVDDIWIRDPFILLYENVYFLYGTGFNVNGYICYASYDLQTWYGPKLVFDATEATEQYGFEGVGDYWATECHIYKGDFYLFASYRSGKTGYHGTSVFKSESPLGPFVEISDGPVTPQTRDCIDGTLYVENGVPYMVYSEELTSDPDLIGGMAYAQLSNDLTHFVSEPATIFRANDPSWVTRRNQVTDGPFLYKTSNGELCMLWSTFDKGYYLVTTAYSSDGTINGEWHHSSIPL